MIYDNFGSASNLTDLHLRLLPPELLSSLEGVAGFARDTFEQVHISGEQVSSIRLNPGKMLSNSTKMTGGDLSISIQGLPLAEKIPWSSNGYYLSARPSFTLDPLFHAGLYYVQEASSQFLEEALKQTVDLSKPTRVLDLCAAPGGKSTLIQSLISNESLLVSNEVIKSRVSILQENIIKWGSANVIVTNNDPKDFARLENYFDVMVVDAPCSGSGLFRRDPDAIDQWSVENVKLCSMRQQRILADAWPALKEDGILIFSTCSYSKEENEDNIDWIMEHFQTRSLALTLNGHDEFDKTENDWPITQVTSDRHNGYGYRFYPDKIKGEGFFIACFQKKEGSGTLHQKTKKDLSEPLNKNELVSIKRYLSHEIPLDYFKYNDLVYAIPGKISDTVSYIRKNLFLRKAGVLLGKFAGNELIPEHELAMSQIVSSELPSINLNREEALQFLRREELKIESAGKGWVLAKFGEINLGWMKILQNRINNYYPKEWRIRMV